MVQTHGSCSIRSGPQHTPMGRSAQPRVGGQRQRGASETMDRTLLLVGRAASMAGRCEEPMSVRCTFHVSSTAIPQPKPERRSMPSIEVEVDSAEEKKPRGRSFETWTRARGWASED